MTVAATQPLQTSTDLPLADIAESPLNHRKYFDEAKLEELARSIEAHGVLQPVMVRPSTDPKRKQPYELVYGHSRFRAAKVAGLKAIPALVRELTDRQVLEIALIENCRRQDIRAMEEAEAFRDLYEKHGLKVEEIADQVGKSKEYVYGRKKLAELRPVELRKKLEQGELAVDTALLVARIPIEALQLKAAERILQGEYDHETGKPKPMPFRRAKELIEKEYMLRLADAPFDPKDAELVPAAGTCEACPKRTGNCAALYPEVKNANICTDPECFAVKKRAHVARTSAKAKEKGAEVLPPSRSKGVLQPQWNGGVTVSPSSGFIALNAEVPTDPKKKWKDVLGKDVEKVVAIDQEGKAHDLVRIDVAKKAVKEAGLKVKVPEPPKTHAPAKADAASEAERKAKRERREALAKLVLERVVAAAEKPAHALEVLRFATEDTLESLGLNEWALERRGLKNSRFGRGAWAELVEKHPEPKLRGLCVDALLSEAAGDYVDGYYPERFEQACRRFGVDPAKLELELPDAKPAAGEKGQAGTCRVCGCTEEKACSPPCWWVSGKEDLCSSCAGKETSAAAAKKKPKAKPAKKAAKAKKRGGKR